MTFVGIDVYIKWKLKLFFLPISKLTTSNLFIHLEISPRNNTFDILGALSVIVQVTSIITVYNTLWRTLTCESLYYCFNLLLRMC